MPTNYSVTTNIQVYVDDSSHNTPSYIYAKQYDTHSRFVKAYLMSNEGQYEIDNTVQLNAVLPDDSTQTISGTANADGSATFELSAGVLALPGTVSCDITVTSNSSVILTSSTFYIVVDKSNYNPS